MSTSFRAARAARSFATTRKRATPPSARGRRSTCRISGSTTFRSQAACSTGGSSTSGASLMAREEAPGFRGSTRRRRPRSPPSPPISVRSSSSSGVDRQLRSQLDCPTGACWTSVVDEPTNASTPPLVLGRYLLGAQLGQGGMGRVHGATDTRLRGRKVAVKTLVIPDVAPDMKAELTERFEREPEILALIKHKHVVDVLDYGRDADGTLYLVTELLEGDTLHDHLYLRGEPFPIAQAADLALELCAGIQACHANGVIHRDLKPGNVFLVKAQTGSGLEVKIIDFGLSKGQHAQRITRAGIVPGTKIGRAHV